MTRRAAYPTARATLTVDGVPLTGALLELEWPAPRRFRYLDCWDWNPRRSGRRTFERRTPIYPLPTPLGFVTSDSIFGVLWTYDPALAAAAAHTYSNQTSWASKSAAEILEDMREMAAECTRTRTDRPNYTDAHAERAAREGITRAEAKQRNFFDNAKLQPLEFVNYCELEQRFAADLWRTYTQPMRFPPLTFPERPSLRGCSYPVFIQYAPEDLCPKSPQSKP